MMGHTVFATTVSIVSIFLSACAGTVRPESTSAGPEQGQVAPPSIATSVRPKMSPEEEGRANAAVAKANGRATAEYHFSMAQAYSTEGESDRAIEEYKLTLMFDPDSAIVYSRLAGEYVKKGMLSLAMETCRDALARDSKMVDARLMLAGLYSTARENSAALREYDLILNADPGNEEAVVYKAQVLVEDEKASEASSLLRKFVKKAGESAVAWYYLGRVEQKRGKTAEAIFGYRRALVLRPSFSQAGLALGYLYEEKGQAAKAIEIYREIYDQSQEMAAANRLATLYLKDEKYKDAVPFLEAIAASDPDDLNVRVKLGLVKMELHDFERAISAFNEILVKHPDADRIHYYLGSIYEEQKKFPEAVEELKKIQGESKLFTDAALHVAYLHKQLNQLSEAKSQIADAIQKSPRIPGFYLFQASLEEEEKNIDGAVKILETAVDKFPEEEKLIYYLGSLYDRQGQTDRSLEQMERLLRLNPQNVDAMNYIGYTWTLRGVRLSDAGKLLKKAVSMRPENAYIQDSWGWYLFVRGRVNEAVVQLERAVKLKPSEPTIIEHLADAYAKSNLIEKALVRYQEAERLTEEGGAKQKLAGKIQNLTQQLVDGGRLRIRGDRVPASLPSQPEPTQTSSR